MLTRQVLLPCCGRSRTPQTKKALSISTSEMEVSRRRLLFARSRQTVVRYSSKILSPRLPVSWRCDVLIAEGDMSQLDLHLIAMKNLRSLMHSKTRHRNRVHSLYKERRSIHGSLPFAD